PSMRETHHATATAAMGAAVRATRAAKAPATTQPTAPLPMTAKAARLATAGSWSPAAAGAPRRTPGPHAHRAYTPHMSRGERGCGSRTAGWRNALAAIAGENLGARV